MTRARALGVALAAALAAPAIIVGLGGGSGGGGGGVKPAWTMRAAGVPSLSFEPNVGQTDPTVRFLARTPGATVFLTAREAVLALDPPGSTTPDVLRIRLAGSRPAAAIAGAGQLPGTVNYLGAAGSRADVATYGGVVYRSVYPGIDLRYHGAGSRLAYDFELAPAADAREIRVDLLGSRRLGIDRHGKLAVGVDQKNSVVQDAPRVYQRRDGVEQPVSGRYVLRGPHSVGFALGPYDHARPLVIDPAIAYATLLHGTREDAGRAIAVDAAGDAYVTGDTRSLNFPTRRALHPRATGPGVNAFVVKLDPAGGVVYSTYLGGSGYTSGRGIAVDRTGAAYVTGATNSTDLPTTRGAVQRSFGGGPFDAFAIKLDPAGTALAYSTYLGDTHYDEGNAIAVDATGRAVLAGRTVSPNFPVSGGLEPHVAGGAFVVRLSRTGRAISYATVFGGGGTANHGDTAFGVAVDRPGAAYVTGVTNAADFPTTSPLQPSLRGASDAFVAKINAAGTAVVYSTYLGGSRDEIGRAIAADNDGNAYLTGTTTSPDFPTMLPLQGSGAAADAFVTKLDPAGRSLVFSTYLGGTGDDTGSAIALDRSRDVYVTGQTASTDFPTAHALQPALAGAGDAFVSEIDRAGDSLVRSTFLGGSGGDAGLGVAVARAGTIFVTGAAGSADFPARAVHAGRKVSGAPGVSGAFVVAARPG